MNYREALRRAEQTPTPSMLNTILETVRERFPDQSDDNLLTMILEVLSFFKKKFLKYNMKNLSNSYFQVKRSNNNSLKNVTMNRVIRDIQNLINNSILDQGYNF